jgi:hypothetical protein
VWPDLLIDELISIRIERREDALELLHLLVIEGRLGGGHGGGGEAERSELKLGLGEEIEVLNGQATDDRCVHISVQMA